MKDTVIFDMDGLLVNSEPYWEEAMLEIYEKLGISLNQEDYRKTIGLPTYEIVEYWNRIYDHKQKSVEELTAEIVQKAQSLIIKNGHLMEGSKGILEFFKTKNYRIGLASSSPLSMIEAVLQHFGIRKYFETVHSGEQHSYGKPHPAVYIACAKALKTKPMDCLVFEDSINGMIAAKAAKMKVIVVPEPHNREDIRFSLADAKLNSLKEFDEAVWDKVWQK